MLEIIGIILGWASVIVMSGYLGYEYRFLGNFGSILSAIIWGYIGYKLNSKSIIIIQIGYIIVNIIGLIYFYSGGSSCFLEN